jgi:S1-C subfamily serine protease
MSGVPARALAVAVAFGFAFGASVLLAACTSSGSSHATSSAQSPTGTATATLATGPDLQQEFVSTIRQVLPSVVLIQTTAGLGSGVVFDGKGDIVTNAHVVGRATTFQVTLANTTKTVPATLVGSYPAGDLAVIKVSGVAGLHPATFADSSKQEVGDIVLAMGNPLGLASSVTNGIISAVGRTLTEPADANSPGATLPDCIQTSADINPGNSGGALVNLAGQVVGVPTLAATDPQMGGAAPGIGFAIASNTVKDIAGQLVANGKVVNSHRAALNVTVATVADPNGQPAGAGVVSVAPGGAAAKAGIRPGDIVLQINGVPTPSAQALSAVLATLRPGQTVDVQLRRTSGRIETIHLTLGTL